MNLPTFPTFDEKAEIFRHVICNTIEDFDSAIQEFLPQPVRLPVTGEIRMKSNLFRGVNDSSFRIFSSIQRCFNQRLHPAENTAAGEEKPPIIQVNSLPELLDEIYRRFHQENNHYLYDEYRRQYPTGVSSAPSVWAFIQHFGGPSPLVDFTSDFESALFFAFDRMKPSVAGNPMSEYVSLYIYPDNPMATGELGTLTQYDAARAVAGVREVLEEMPDAVIDTDAVCVQLYENPLNQIAWGAMVYGGSKSRIEYQIPDAEFSTLTSAVDNVNIEAQLGNFFQGHLKDMVPLELADNLRMPYRDLDGTMLYSKYGTCIEIHKSLAEDLRRKYNIPTEEEVYPNREQLKDLYSAMEELWQPLTI